MMLSDFKQEIISWRFSKQRVINLTIGLSALLVYEFAARPYYRPYIYSQNIYDFHIADTLGNSLGTIAAVFILLFILGGEKSRDNYLIKTIIMSVAVYEMAQPLLGKPIDAWDIVATIFSGGFCLLMYGLIYSEKKTTGN